MTIQIRLGNSMTPAIRARVGAWCDSRTNECVREDVLFAR